MSKMTVVDLAIDAKLITPATGNAVVVDVLATKTFSNATANGLTGTMPNIGKQDITPSAVEQSITLGYHDGTGVVSAIVIPESNELKVTTEILQIKSVAENEFADAMLERIVIPGGVETIGAGSFSGNDIVEVVIPANVVITDDNTIGTYGAGFKALYDVAKNAGVYKYVAGAWGKISNAEGGIITYADGYKYHTFLSSGTLTMLTDTAIEVLLVAGGGGGSSGAGGGGGLVSYSGGLVAVVGAHDVVVGAGGAKVANVSTDGNNGENSTFAELVAYGGGGGGKNPTTTAGKDGASGGGGGSSNINKLGGLAIYGQGYNGGGNGGFGNVAPYPSGGGGGHSAAGQTAPNNSTAGNGGAGSIVWGLSVCGGGGGSTFNVGGTAGTASHGGGAGGRGINGSDATPNTGGGGGGGGGGTGYQGGAGGSGIVVIRYLSDE